MKNLLDGFHHFRQHVYPRQQALFRSLAGGQSPQTMLITCADSRVSPEMIFSAQPGELFVQRNIGNVVPPYSQHVSGVVAAIEYAVVALGVSDIVVCGHSDCGAMKAALDRPAVAGMPSVAHWLRHVDAACHVVAHRHADRPCAEGNRLAQLTEENVVAQLDHLRTHPVVAARLASAALRIHGWVYDIEHGDIHAFDAEHGHFVPLLRDGAPLPVATPRPRLGLVRGGGAKGGAR